MFPFVIPLFAQFKKMTARIYDKDYVILFDFFYHAFTYSLAHFYKSYQVDPAQPTDQLEIYQLRLRLLVDFQRSASYFFTRLS